MGVGLGFRLEKRVKDDLLLFVQMIMCRLKILNFKIGSQEDLEKKILKNYPEVRYMRDTCKVYKPF